MAAIINFEKATLPKSDFGAKSVFCLTGCGFFSNQPGSARRGGEYGKMKFEC